LQEQTCAKKDTAVPDARQNSNSPVGYYLCDAMALV
jgi:hypothetical protein